VIVVRNLCKSFGDIKAVNGVSFVARDGEITGLLGPNGAGKTTTLRMLYSLLPPDAGEILIDGLDPNQDAMEIKRTLGVVPDNRGLYSRLTARENISYYGELHGMKKRQIAQRIDQLVVHRSAHRGFFTGPTGQGRDRAGHGPRTANRPAGRAEQWTGCHEHPRVA